MSQDIIRSLKDENEILQYKLKKLAAFMDTDCFESLTEIHQRLLHAQVGSMLAYANILTVRIINLESTDV